MAYTLGCTCLYDHPFFQTDRFLRESVHFLKKSPKYSKCRAFKILETFHVKNYLNCRKEFLQNPFR